VLTRAEERGFPRLRLWVLADNVRARRFYERAGFTADGAEQWEEHGDVSLREVRYAREVAPGGPDVPGARGTSGASGPSEGAVS
jgi:hypothetical protein